MYNIEKRGDTLRFLLLIVLLAASFIQAKAVSDKDLTVQKDYEAKFGNIKAQVLHFGGISTPKCQFAISNDGHYFYFTKLNSTCKRLKNSKGKKIVCNSDKSVCYSREELIKFIKNGKMALPNAKKKNNSQLNKDLVKAIQNGELKTVKELVSKGANVNNRDEKGLTPLFYAIRNQHLDIVKYLVSKNADVYAKTEKTKITPLVYAIAEGNLDIVKYLFGKFGNLNSEIINNWQPIHCAVNAGRLDIINYFISKGVSVNSTTKEEYTPLYFAIKNKDLKTVKFLISKGADVNFKVKDGTTPLYYAIIFNDLNIVKYLISKGAKINTKTKEGLTPLMMASIKGNLEIVKYLVSKGADLKDIKLVKKIAKSSGHNDIAEYLDKMAENKK